MKSITITGALGSGKSTVAHLISDKTGYTYYSTGQAQRQLAAQKGITTLELNKLAETDMSIDAQIDGIFKQMNQSPTPFVVDSRLAWYFMPASFKVKLITDREVAAERIMGDVTRSGEKKYASLAEALEATDKRRQSEVSRFKKIYGIDIEDNTQFDLIVDTTRQTPEQVSETILRAYQQKL